MHESYRKLSEELKNSIKKLKKVKQFFELLIRKSLTVLIHKLKKKTAWSIKILMPFLSALHKFIENAYITLKKKATILR